MEWYQSHFRSGIVPVYRPKANKSGQVGFQSEVILTNVPEESSKKEKIISSRIPSSSAKLADQNVALLAFHFLHKVKI